MGCPMVHATGQAMDKLGVCTWDNTWNIPCGIPYDTLHGEPILSTVE